jgi:hypothetical protein
MWTTIHPDKWRRLVIRIFWDGEEHPSVEVPLGDCSKAALGLANTKPDDFHYD